MGNRYENTKCKISFAKGVCIVDFKEGVDLTKQDALDIVNKRNEMQAGTVMPLLIFDEGVNSVEKEALKVFGSDDCFEYVSVVAFWISKKWSNIKMFSYFLLFYFLLKRKFKIFTGSQSQNEITDWLNLHHEISCEYASQPH